MKRSLAFVLSGVLFLAGPVAVAPAQTGDSEQQTQNNDDDDFPYGLIGLLGLAGLAGLKRRNDHDHDHTGTSTTRRP